jgi:CDP-glucose 4,6-dehydratase
VSARGFWSDRSVLVTGCTGLLGSWLTRALVDRGALVVGLVRDWVPQSELVARRLIDQIRVVRGDVRERDTLERALGEYEVETVFHLAAQTIVGIANSNPVSTLETNIDGTWAVLEACRRSPGVCQVLVASSDKAYGAHEVLPYVEDVPLRGQHPYDVSKACADMLAQSYAVSFGLPVCVTRCGNLYGGGDLNWNRLVPGTVRSALRGERPIIRSDGSFVRDYFYVEDAAIAYLTLAEHMADHPELAGEPFNFSSERPIGARDLASLILVEVGRPDLTLDIRSTAHNEIERQYLDSSKARRVLGWQPRFGLEEGLRLTVSWYRDFLSAGEKRG